jgi:catechol 2,3-dioxygenase-like lactoylglutathione lyase family enzyme
MTILHLAILTDSYSRAVDWVREAFGQNLVELKATQGKGIVTLYNVNRPFIIVHDDREERLRGYELIGFHVIGYVRPRLIDVALARVRA